MLGRRPVAFRRLGDLPFRRLGTVLAELGIAGGKRRRYSDGDQWLARAIQNPAFTIIYASELHHGLETVKAEHSCPAFNLHPAPKDLYT